jgi:hypothetical protein
MISFDCSVGHSVTGSSANVCLALHCNRVPAWICTLHRHSDCLLIITFQTLCYRCITVAKLVLTENYSRCSLVRMVRLTCQQQGAASST